MMRFVRWFVLGGLLITLAPQLAHAQGAGTGKVWFTADTAGTGSSSSGCVRQTVAANGEVVWRCTPGADAEIFIPGNSPETADMTILWSYKVHDSTIAASGACTWEVAYLILDDNCDADALPDWTANANTDKVQITTAGHTQFLRAISSQSATFKPLRCSTGADLDTAANGQLNQVLAYVHLTSATAATCDFRALETFTK